jgi:hypothetical protein
MTANRRQSPRKTAAPVTLAHVERAARGMTLAEAGRQVTKAGGKIDLEGGRLVVPCSPARRELSGGCPDAASHGRDGH